MIHTIDYHVDSDACPSFSVHALSCNHTHTQLCVDQKTHQTASKYNWDLAKNHIEFIINHFLLNTIIIILHLVEMGIKNIYLPWTYLYF